MFQGALKGLAYGDLQQKHVGRIIMQINLFLGLDFSETCFDTYEFENCVRKH